MTHFAPEPTATPEPLPPTQVRHPLRATLRTVVQNLATIGVLIGAITGAAQDEQIGWVTAWGPSAIAFSLFLTRVMQLPGVDKILTSYGLGAAPAAA